MYLIHIDAIHNGAVSLSPLGIYIKAGRGGASLSPLPIYIMTGRGGAASLSPFGNIYYAGAGVAFNKSDMLVPSAASLAFTSVVGVADAADAVGGAVASATTGTDMVGGIVCTFFATSLFTF